MPFVLFSALPKLQLENLLARNTKLHSKGKSMTSDMPTDSLNRGPYLDGLLTLITRLDKGVIAIDGEWGVGKTWAGKNLKQKLDQKQQMKTIWLDVFEADWSDDPAVSLIAAIAAKLDPEPSQTFIEKVAPVLAAILPLAAKAVINAAANYAGMGEEITKEAADAGKTETQKYIQKHLEASREKQKNLGHLKDLLNKTISENGGKLVIFVDELDRCSPGFAVRFLERLKHLFDLDSVIYILLWNREQVQKTIEVFYGVGSSGQMYLDKFIDYPLHIPVSQNNNRDKSPMEDFISAIIPIVDGRTRQPHDSGRLNENVYCLALIAHILGLTARETKRLAAWWVMSPNRAFPVLDTWLLGLKVKHPDIFAGLRKGNQRSHERARDILEQWQSQEKEKPDATLALIQLHMQFANSNFENFPVDLLEYVTSSSGRFAQAIKSSLRRVEFEFG
jgi:hypothetical protein